MHYWLVIHQALQLFHSSATPNEFAGLKKLPVVSNAAAVITARECNDSQPN